MIMRYRSPDNKLAAWLIAGACILELTNQQ